MTRPWDAILAALVLAIALAQAWAPRSEAAPRDPIGQLVNGEIDTLPALWGDSPLEYRNLPPLLRFLPDSAPASAALPPRRADAPDNEVSALTVRGLREVGPAWWKVTDADTTVWILATPDAFPNNTQFSAKTMEARIRAARQVILPARLDSDTGATVTRLRSPSQALGGRLPPALLARLAGRIDLRPAEAGPQAGAAYQSLAQFIATPTSSLSTYQIASRLAQATTFPIHDQHIEQQMGNPAAETAAAIAASLRVRVTRLRGTAAESAMLALVEEPDEIEQQRCLDAVLDMLDAGLTGVRRLSTVEAWAMGDVVNAMKRLNIMSECSHATSEGRRFWNTLISENVAAIVTAMAQPGQVVAVIEFDPLQMSNGVLDQLAARGYAITAPLGAERQPNALPFDQSILGQPIDRGARSSSP